MKMCTAKKKKKKKTNGDGEAGLNKMSLRGKLSLQRKTKLDMPQYFVLFLSEKPDRLKKMAQNSLVISLQGKPSQWRPVCFSVLLFKVKRHRLYDLIQYLLQSKVSLGFISVSFSGVTALLLHPKYRFFFFPPCCIGFGFVWFWLCVH